MLILFALQMCCDHRICARFSGSAKGEAGGSRRARTSGGLSGGGGGGEGGEKWSREARCNCNSGGEM